jgi:uroporphyrinogen-III synthase
MMREEVGLIKRVLYLGTEPPIAQKGEIITHWPLIRIAPRPFADLQIQECFKDFTNFTHLIITSKNTVPILHEYLDRSGYERALWKEKKMIAVGKKTAKALQEAGCKKILIAEDERAEGVVDLLSTLDGIGNCFFWPHSGQARSVIDDFLEERRMKYKSCCLYDPVPIAYLPADIPELDQFDEIVFTSPSVVNAFLLVFGKLPNDEKCRVIGPITADYLKEQSAIQRQSNSKTRTDR